MPIDRNDTIRRAEKLLRQGRLDAAIAEYTKVVDEHPRDLNTANLLGDLYLRAGQVDRAVAQYIRMAEFLVQDGFVPKAAALYKKIIKIKPDDDRALLRMADLAAAQGLIAEARLCLQVLCQARVRRQDSEGAAVIAQRRVQMDPADPTARLDAARLLANVGDTTAAAEQLREAGLTLLAQGRHAEGTRALTDALGLQADDASARDQLVEARVRAGELEAAAEAARTAGQLGLVARAILADGRGDAAVACLARALSLRPDDAEIRLELARIELECGHAEAAAAALPPPSDGEGPGTTLLRAEVLARSGQRAEASGLVGRLVRRDPAAVESAADLCLSLAAFDSAGAAACLASVVDAVRLSGNLTMVRSAAERLVDASDAPVDALRLLVDVCDDLADEDGIYHGQVRLTDALLAAGLFDEARVLADVLIGKRPDVRRHAERLRAAMAGLGASAVVDVEFSLPPARPDRPLASSHEGGAEESAVSGPAEPDVFSLDPVDADLRGTLESVEITPVSEPERESFDVDLSQALNTLMTAGLAPLPLPLSPTDGPEPDTKLPVADLAGQGLDAVPNPSDGPVELDGFFQSLREESGSAERARSASRSFDMASAAYVQGRLDEARSHLEQAARDPAFRFRATALLGCIARDGGHVAEATEWFERAAESPAPSAGAWGALLYDLGATLWEAGETSRALAVFMELQSASPGYRDVEDRIVRLSEPRSAEGRIAPDRDSG